MNLFVAAGGVDPRQHVTSTYISQLRHSFNNSCRNPHVLSNPTKQANVKIWSSGSGILLIVLSLSVVVFDSSNFLAFGLAFFVLLAGIMLVMMGFIGTQEEQKKQPAQYCVVTREIVKVRCGHCSSLNLETNNRCTNCGASL